MPLYDLGLTVANGENYNTQRVQIEADTIAAACLEAEAMFPGFKVHHGWCIEGARADKTDDDLARWMQDRHNQTQ